MAVDHTRFLGRDAEIAALQDALQHAQLVTVLGPPGAGKSRLVRESALRLIEGHQWPGGIWWAPLDVQGPTHRLEHGVAQALGIPLGHADHLAQTLRTTLAGLGRTLIVLDNLESVAEASYEPLRAWMADAPDVRFVSTSRRATGLPEELVMHVGPLPGPTAAALFADRSERVGTPIAVDDPVLMELVDALDRLPLAVELAAARAGALGVPTVLELVRRGDWGAPRADVPLRAASVQHAMEASWASLRPHEQRALQDCAVFPASFDRAAAEAVLAGPQPLQALSRLVDQSLVAADRPESGGSVSYRLLHVVRTFVERQPHPERSAVRTRHGDYYLDLVEDLVPDLNGPHRVAHLFTIDRAWPHVQAALTHAWDVDPERAAHVLYEAGRSS